MDALIPTQLRPSFQWPGRDPMLGLLSAASDDQVAPAPERGKVGMTESERRAAGGYDPEFIRDFALERPFALAARAAQVGWSLGKLSASLKLDEWLGREDSEEVVRERAAEIKATLLGLGPCYIKLGQALANRPDILRDDYMAELEQLQDQVPAFPTEEAMAILRAELGRDPRDIFSELTPEPVAGASLGQVYRGRLRATDQEVAVKVQRPGLKDALNIDFHLFRELAQQLNEWALQSLGCNITLVVDEFGAKLWEESNYQVEALNCESFSRNFVGDATVKIPTVYLEHTTTRVITMEWIDGVKCTDVAGLRRAGIDIDTFTRNGVQAALRQLLEFGLFHGDPHAGNIFALKDGKIAYVDFGNVAVISSAQRDVLVRAIAHVSNSDYEGIARDFVRLGFLRPGTDVSELVPAMAVIWKDSMGKSIRDFNFRTITSGFSKLVYRFPLRIPERFSLVIKALLMQEGICLCLNPDFSVIEVALPYASSRLLSNPDPSMRRELMSIVFREEGGRLIFQWEQLRNLVSMAKQARGGASLRLDDVIVDFFRGWRRELREARAAGPGGPGSRARAAEARGVADVSAYGVLQGGLEALTGGEFQLNDAKQVLELLGPDLSPALATRVADVLWRDSMQDAFEESGEQLRKFLPGYASVGR